MNDLVRAWLVYCWMMMRAVKKWNLHKIDTACLVVVLKQMPACVRACFEESKVQGSLLSHVPQFLVLACRFHSLPQFRRFESNYFYMA